MELKEIVNSAFDESAVDRSTREKVFTLLGRLEEYHQLTYEHSLRVGLLSKDIGRMQNKEHRAGLYGVLHDIGKIKIPRSLLDKTEGFDDNDIEIMKGHVKEGYKILIEAGLPFSSWIALTHHRYQPKFYPGEDEMSNYQFPIPNASPSTRLLADTWSGIVGIGDAYDASKHRKNDMFGGLTLTSEELRAWLTKQYPSSEHIIDEAYERGIIE